MCVCVCACMCVLVMCAWFVFRNWKKNTSDNEFAAWSCFIKIYNFNNYIWNGSVTILQKLIWELKFTIKMSRTHMRLYLMWHASWLAASIAMSWGDWSDGVCYWRNEVAVACSLYCTGMLYCDSGGVAADACCRGDDYAGVAVVQSMWRCDCLEDYPGTEPCPQTPSPRIPT